MKGINDFPICGDETDKVPFWMSHNTEVIAKGVNTSVADTVKVYKEGDPEWDGDGGGEIVLKERPVTMQYYPQVLFTADRDSEMIRCLQEL
ncbi:MAG: hypothetical protein IPM96_13940 [Ignavibacteria bacterium]|nr:hypothetical protein [Ignavibacteria bacterium]